MHKYKPAVSFYLKLQMCQGSNRDILSPTKYHDDVPPFCFSVLHMQQNVASLISGLHLSMSHLPLYDLRM